MENYWIFIILILISLNLINKWVKDSSKDLSGFIEPKLKSRGFKMISCTYPGLFKVGPFKKIEWSIGKPQINNGNIQYEYTYYRIVKFKTNNNVTAKVWAKIETNWFKETKIEFKPKLSGIY